MILATVAEFKGVQTSNLSCISPSSLRFARIIMWYLHMTAK